MEDGNVLSGSFLSAVLCHQKLLTATLWRTEVITGTVSQMKTGNQWQERWVKLQKAKTHVGTLPHGTFVWLLSTFLPTLDNRRSAEMWNVKCVFCNCVCVFCVAEADAGTVAGIASAIGVALLGAASSYFAYQKKKLCFKIQGGRCAFLFLFLTITTPDNMYSSTLYLAIRQDCFLDLSLNYKMSENCCFLAFLSIFSTFLLLF